MGKNEFIKKVRERCFVNFEVKECDNYITLTFPCVGKSDYFFRLYCYENGQMSLGAYLSRNNQASPERSYFWHVLIEIYASRKASDVENDALEKLDKIFKYPTRIIQRKGWFFWHFTCEYLDNNGYKQLGSNSTFRFFSFRVPLIAGGEKIYTAEPLENWIPSGRKD